MTRPKPIRSNGPKRRAKQAQRMWQTALGILLVVALLLGTMTGLWLVQSALNQRREAKARAAFSAPARDSARQGARNGTKP